MAAVLAAVLAAAALTGCAGGSGQGRGDRVAGDSGRPPGPPPQTFQSTPEPTMSIDHRKVTTIRSTTVGVIANEPTYITAAVVGISADGRASIAGNADKEPYRRMDLSDGQDFEVHGVRFHIETDPQRHQVTIYQLAG